MKSEPLPLEEEQRLGRIIKSGGPPEDVRRAVATLVEAHLRLVLWVAQRHTRGRARCNIDELVSEGYAKLIIHGGTFDVDRSKFCTWAVTVLRREFATFARGASGSVRWWRRVSMSSQLDDEGNTYGSAAVSLDPEPVEIPEEALAKLSARQRDILDRRYGLRGRLEQTLREIGRDLGLTHQAIDLAEREALRKLREAMGVSGDSLANEACARRRKEISASRRRQRNARWMRWHCPSERNVPRRGNVASAITSESSQT